MRISRKRAGDREGRDEVGGWARSMGSFFFFFLNLGGRMFCSNEDASFRAGCFPRPGVSFSPSFPCPARALLSLSSFPFVRTSKLFFPLFIPPSPGPAPSSHPTTARYTKTTNPPPLPPYPLYTHLMLQERRAANYF